VKSLLERRFQSRFYVPLVLAIWIFMPEIRRIVDWRSSFHALTLLSIVPLLSLLPGIFLLPAAWAKLSFGFRRVAAVWLIAFGYALAVAILNHSLLSALYSAAQFGMPILFGVLLIGSNARDASTLYQRLANSLLVMMTISALYGIFQYVAPPAWDVYWAQQADVEASQGETVAFGFRIFGTLNSTGPFSSTLLLTLLLNLPRLDVRRWYVSAAFVPLLIALALTSVRSCWIGLAVGLVVYGIFAAGRLRAASAFTLLIIAFVGISAVISYTVPSAEVAFTTLNARINSLSELQYDHSADVRKQETAEALSDSLEQPLGLGLGTVGTSAKLSTTGSTISLDNGFLARLVEMGFAGFALYAIAIIMAIAVAFKAHGVSKRAGNLFDADACAAVIAVQFVLLSLEAASDAHLGFSGMIFWAIVALSSGLLSDKVGYVRAAFSYPPLTRTSAVSP